MKIETTEQLITPAKANEIMERHYERIATEQYAQRPLLKSLAARYAADMKAGNWLFTPEAITFDEKGDLLNGQHRLEAIRLAGVPIRFMVSTGWPVNSNGSTAGVIDVIDAGKKRSVSDMLHMHGTKYSSRFSGTARGIALIANECTAGLGISYPAALFILDKLGIREAVEMIMAKATSLTDLKVPILSGLSYYYTTSPRKAIAFADDLFNFSAEKGSPVQAFLSWSKTKRNTADNLKGICSAIRAYELEESKQVIKPTTEAIRWLKSTNLKLAGAVIKVCPR